MSGAHTFVSAVADGVDATLVQPGDWNDPHDGVWDQPGTPTVDQTVRAGYSAVLEGLPLIVSSGRLVTIAAGAVLILKP